MLGMALLTVGSCKKESRNNAVTWSSNPHLAIVKWYKFISADEGRAAIRPEANSHYLIYFRTVGKCVIRVRTRIWPGLPRQRSYRLCDGIITWWFPMDERRK